MTYRFAAVALAALLVTHGGTNQSAWGTPTQDDTQEAVSFFQELSRGRDNPLIANMAQENLVQLQAQLQGKRKAFRQFQEARIPLLRQQNNNLLLQGLVNQRMIGTFMVDTGATYTVISPYMAKQLGIQVNTQTPRVTLMTGNGTVQAPLVTVKSLTLGGVQLKNVPVVIHTMGHGPMLAGVIGMTTFEGMDVSFKGDELVLQRIQ